MVFLAELGHIYVPIMLNVYVYAIYCSNQ